MSSYYNDRYFLRRLSNASFADIVLRSCTAKGAGAALGVFPEKEEELLEDCHIPGARISLGNVSGDQDKDRLNDEAYRSKMAEGIYEGILGAIEVME